MIKLQISIVGAGMVSTPGVTFECLELSDENINILAISTSEIKLRDEDNTLKAIKKLHTIFDLD